MASLEYSSDLISYGSGAGNLFPGNVTGDDPRGNGTLPSSSAGGQKLDVPDDPTGSSIDIPEVPWNGSDRPIDDEYGPANQDQGNTMLILLIVVLILCAVSAVAFIVRRRRRRKSAGDESASSGDDLPSDDQARGLFEGRYTLRFPQIREQFPLTWGTNEALEIVIDDKTGACGEAVLSVDEEAVMQVSLDNGAARVMIELEKGRHRIAVTAKDDDRSGEASWADVRIVDYREEIVRIFNELCSSLKSRVAGVQDRMTPRELARHVNAETPEAGQRMPDSVVVIFETANYSVHAMGREDYEKMYVSGACVT
jgi:hypothetical protein